MTTPAARFMNPELIRELHRLRNDIAHCRVQDDPSVLANRLNSLGLPTAPDKLAELMPILIQSFVGDQSGSLHIPPLLLSILAKILEGRSAKIICDPWAGLGGMLAIAQSVVPAANCIAFNTNALELKLATALFPQAQWSLGQPLMLLEKLESPIDIGVSCLPFGARSKETLTITDTKGNPVELRDSLGNLILSAATAKLSHNGVGLFVVTPSFFFAKQSVLNRFPELGFNVDAALALPPGSFAPYTSISTYLVIVTKSQPKPMFVAQITSDANTNSQILSNLSNGTEGGAVELGRYVEVIDFRGIDALRAADYFETASKQIGFPAVDLEELAIDINLGRFGDGFTFPPAENAVYIPMIGQGNVVDSIDELTLKEQNYAQVVIDPAKSYAAFVAQFLNSELGKKIREWGKTGTTIPKLNKQTLKRVQILIPNLAVQREILAIEARLSTEENTLLGLQNDLLEMRRELWANPRGADTIGGRLEAFSLRMSGELKNQATTSLDQWFESIPFPLASILRAWQATPTDDYKSKHEHLLHFFEATAAFLSVIFLSAFSANEGLYSLHRAKLNEAMAKQKLSFQSATFGSWKLVVEYLGKQTRLLLQEHGKKSTAVVDDRAVCASIFADSTLRLPSVISNKEIASILATTNKWRNDWKGHGGIVGQDEARLRNEQLLGQVEKMRQAMSDLWETTAIVYSLHTRPRNGVFENEIAILKGSNSEFLKESRKMSAWLDVERLYVVNKAQGSALKLLPLIRIDASPDAAKNACYFFNRSGRDGSRFVSYHFAGKAELSVDFQETANTLKFLCED